MSAIFPPQTDTENSSMDGFESFRVTPNLHIETCEIVSGEVKQDLMDLIYHSPERDAQMQRYLQHQAPSIQKLGQMLEDELIHKHIIRNLQGEAVALYFSAPLEVMTDRQIAVTHWLQAPYQTPFWKHLEEELALVNAEKQTTILERPVNLYTRSENHLDLKVLHKELQQQKEPVLFLLGTGYHRFDTTDKHETNALLFDELKRLNPKGAMLVYEAPQPFKSDYEARISTNLAKQLLTEADLVDIEALTSVFGGIPISTQLYMFFGPSKAMKTVLNLFGNEPETRFRLIHSVFNLAEKVLGSDRAKQLRKAFPVDDLIPFRFGEDGTLTSQTHYYKEGDTRNVMRILATSDEKEEMLETLWKVYNESFHPEADPQRIARGAIQDQSMSKEVFTRAIMHSSTRVFMSHDTVKDAVGGFWVLGNTKEIGQSTHALDIQSINFRVPVNQGFNLYTLTTGTSTKNQDELLTVGSVAQKVISSLLFVTGDGFSGDMAYGTRTVKGLFYKQIAPVLNKLSFAIRAKIFTFIGQQWNWVLTSIPESN